METPGQLVRGDGIVLDNRTTITPGSRHDNDGRRICRALAYDTTTTDRHGTTIFNNAFRQPTEAGIPTWISYL